MHKTTKMRGNPTICWHTTLMEISSIEHRSLWYNVDNLSKAVIRDLKGLSNLQIQALAKDLRL